MYTVPAGLRSQSNQAVAPATNGQTGSGDTKVSSEFDTFMRGILKADGENNVNEEELFASLIVERIKALKGQAAADEFRGVLEKHKGLNKGSGGYCFTETAARNALKEFQGSGKLTQEEADKIHSEAFEAAQLDNYKTALFDSIGGANDPTRAVATMEAALLSAQTMLKKFDSGELKASSHPVDSEYPAMGTEPIRTGLLSASGTDEGPMGPVLDGDPNIGAKEAGEVRPKGNKIDGAEGMLWKPHSHTTGKLIMLLPHNYNKQVASITLRDSEGKKIESGRYFTTGGGTAGREKWVFSKGGDKYPKDITVNIKFRDGNIKKIHIANPGQRYD